MAIIGTLPFTIVDGQPIVAAPVMADFNWIVSQVNANVPALLPSTTGAIIYVSTVGGSANAITLAPSPASAGYAAGQSYRFVAGATNTTAVTINVSGLGVRALQYADGTAMTGYEIINGKTVDIMDNGTNYLLMSPPGPSGILTTAAGLTFGGAAVGVTFSTNTITYMKVGRVLYYVVEIGLTSKGSSTGAVLVTGLPYPVNASWAAGTNQVGGGFFGSSLTWTNGLVSPFLDAGLTAIALVNTPSTGGVAAFLTDSNFANNSQVHLTGSYVV